MGGDNCSGSGDSSSSSSGEEDGTEEWKAAINSICSTTFIPSLTKTPPNNQPKNPHHLKLYNIKAHKLLDDIVEKRLEMVRDPVHVSGDDPIVSEGGIRLFKDAPPGIVFDYKDPLQQQRKRPRILPGKEINEKSKKFREQVQSVAIDGDDIMAAANVLCRKLFARQEAKLAAAKQASKREEDRVEQLKRIRGERWLPSIAREMQEMKKKETAREQRMSKSATPTPAKVFGCVL